MNVLQGNCENLIDIYFQDNGGFRHEKSEI